MFVYTMLPVVQPVAGYTMTATQPVVKPVVQLVIQPVVKPVVQVVVKPVLQPLEQLAASCKQTFNRLFSWFDNRLYRVSGVLAVISCCNFGFQNAFCH